jgi:hypothetical protein
VLPFEATSHTPCRSHVVPMPFTCHVAPISLRVLVVSFPFDLHSAATFDSHMSCRARAMPRPCRAESDFLSLRHCAIWGRHGRGMVFVIYYRPSIDGMWATCPRLVLPATMWSTTNVVIRSIPIR